MIAKNNNKSDDSLKMKVEKNLNIKLKHHQQS